MNILHISASPRVSGSCSRKVGGMLVDRLKSQTHAGSTRRDLTTTPPPLPDADFVDASLRRDDTRNDEHRRTLEPSEELICELEAADTVVIDMPMHNFTVPAAFKAWIDMVVRPGRTFALTPEGKAGLIADRPVVLIVACGGRLGDSAQPDFLTPYVRHVFQTMGIHRVMAVHMEGLSRGPEAVEAAERLATESVGAIVEQISAALSPAR